MAHEEQIWRLLLPLIFVLSRGASGEEDSQYHRLQITEARLLIDPTATSDAPSPPLGLLVQLDDGYGPTCIFVDALSDFKLFSDCALADSCVCQSISALPLHSWSPLVVIGSLKTCCEGKGPRKKKRFLNIGDKDGLLAKAGVKPSGAGDLVASWQLINPQTVLVTIRNPQEETWSVNVCLVAGEGLGQTEFEGLIRMGKFKECYKALNFVVKGGKPSLWTKEDVQALVKENLGVAVVWRSAKAKMAAKTEL